MAEEGFFRRWARLKSTAEVEAPLESPTAPAPGPAIVPAPAPPGEPQQAPAPTLDDVARLTPESDYSAFVAKGVDKAVQRMALKKLFADPNFAVMDGLDIYIDDYNKASPLTDAMLASLKHAPGVLGRLFGDGEDGGKERQAGQAQAMQLPDQAQAMQLADQELAMQQLDQELAMQQQPAVAPAMQQPGPAPTTPTQGTP